MGDSAIVASIVAGGPDGLAGAYDRYADPLYKYCRFMLSDPAGAADAVQDTFVIAASRLAGLRDPERLRAWLYAVARNECLRILRARKTTLALDAAPDATDNGADVSDDAERAQLHALLAEAAGGLNPSEREIIELQLRQGLELAEVAAVLGVSRNRAHALVSRAGDRLQACLGVLLVVRVGHAGCGELAAMLAAWDGRLTVPLRKRVHRHIEHCATCSAQRASELRPPMLPGLSPGAALAAAAAESFRLAPGPPAGLKAHMLALALGQNPGASMYRAVVLGRAGAFGRHGFPKPVYGLKAGLPRHPAGVRGRGARLGHRHGACPRHQQRRGADVSGRGCTAAVPLEEADAAGSGRVPHTVADAVAAAAEHGDRAVVDSDAEPEAFAWAVAVPFSGHAGREPSGRADRAGQHPGHADRAGRRHRLVDHGVSWRRQTIRRSDLGDAGGRPDRNGDDPGEPRGHGSAGDNQPRRHRVHHRRRRWRPVHERQAAIAPGARGSSGVRAVQRVWACSRMRRCRRGTGRGGNSRVLTGQSGCVEPSLR